MIKHMNIAINEAKKAYKKEEVPVGAVIIKNNKIISMGHNCKEKQHNALKHAEMIAIDRACKKLKTWRLDDCELYVTLEPCVMCSGAIIESRIKKVYYVSENINNGFLKQNNKYNVELIKIEKEEITEMLKKFFRKRRNK